MSIAISEKIELIRKAEDLSQAELCMKLNLSLNTFKAIIKRGSSPRFDFIERVITTYPQYAAYLCGLDILHVKQRNPESNESNSLDYWKIIQQLRMSELKNKLVVRPEWIEKLIFIEANEDKESLMVIALIKNIDNGDRICVKIGYGEINFQRPGGRNALDRLRDWVRDNINRPDLIKTAELNFCSLEKMNTFYETLIINSKELNDSHQNIGHFLIVNSIFVQWINDEKLEFNTAYF